MGARDPAAQASLDLSGLKAVHALLVAIKKPAQQMGVAIGNAANKASSGLQRLKETLKPLQGMLHNTGGAASSMGNAAAGTANKMSAGLRKAASAITALKQKLTPIKGMFNGISRAASSMGNAAAGAANKMSAGLRKAASASTTLKRGLAPIKGMFGGVSRAASSMQRSISGAATKAASALKGLGGVFALAGKAAKVALGAVTEYVDRAAGLDRTAEALGMSVERLQLWQGAAEAAGGSAEEITARFREMSANIWEAVEQGGGPLQELTKTLGISLTDASGAALSTEEVFFSLAETMAGMDAQAAQGVGRQLGLDEATIDLLRRGCGELDALLLKQQELGVITAEDAKAARRTKEALSNMGRAWGAIGDMLAKLVAPALEWLAEKLTGIAVWIRNNERLFTVFLLALAGIITAVLLPSLISMAIASLAAFAPFLLIGAAIAAVVAAAALIALLIDDFMNWLEGGESLFGGLWQSVSDVFQSIKSAVADLWTYIEPIWNGFKTLWEGVWSLIKGIFTGDMAAIKDGLRLMLQGLIDMFLGWGAMLKDLIIGIVDWIVGVFSNLGNMIGEQIDAAIAAVKDAVANVWADVKSFFGFGGEKTVPPPPSAASAPSVSNTNQSRTFNAETRIGDIAIYTQATDAAGISRDMGSTLRFQTLQADYAMR